MSTPGNLFMSQHDLTSPRSIESRKAVFKIFSETLRPTSKQDQRRSISKVSLHKVNKKSPRTLSNGLKAGYSSHQLVKDNSNVPYSPYAPNRPMKATQRYSAGKLKAKRSGIGGGGEGGPPIRKSTSFHQESFYNAKPSEQSSPTMKDCHLNNVLRSARRCLFELREAKDCLSNIVAQDEQLARGIKKLNPTEDHLMLANVALTITNLCREAFVPAHRLNQTAIALYSAEDFLRYPSDLRTFNLRTKRGRVNLPDMAFNSATVMKLRQVVDLTAGTYNRFDGKGRLGEDLQEILFSMLRGYQDFYAAALGCQEIFKVLLYAGQKDRIHLQQFLLALSPMERSDLLVEIQDLRRILDEIVIFLEKLSWGSFIIHRLAGGENNAAISDSNQYPNVNESGKSTSSMPTYPAYPLLREQTPNLVEKKNSAIQVDSSDKHSYKFHPATSFTSFAQGTSSAEEGDGKKNRVKGGGNNAKVKPKLSKAKLSVSLTTNDKESSIK